MTQRLTVLAAAGIILLGLAGTVFIVLDEQRLKGMVSEWGSSAIGGQLLVRGELRWRWERGLRIELDEIQLDGWTMAQVDSQILAESMTAHVRLLPLLRGQLAVRELEWRNTRVRLSADPTASVDAGQAVFSGPDSLAVSEYSDSAVLGLPERLVFRGLAVDLPEPGSLARAGFSVDEVIVSDLRPGSPIPFMVDGVVLESHILGPLRVQGELSGQENGAWLLADLVAVGQSSDGLYDYRLLGDAELDLGASRLRLNQSHLVINGFDFLLGGVYEFLEGQHFTGELLADVLDVDSLALANHLAGLAHGAGDENSGPSFENYSVELAIAINQIARSGLVLEPFSGLMKVEGGVLTLGEVQAGLPGGWLDGEVNWEPLIDSAWRGEIVLTLANFNDLMVSAGHPLGMSGAGALVLDISSRPVPARGIAASWQGAGSLELLDGYWTALESLPSAASASFESLSARIELQSRAASLSEVELFGDFGSLSGLLLLPFDGRPAAGALSLEKDGELTSSLTIEGPTLSPRLVAPPDRLQQ